MKTCSICNKEKSLSRFHSTGRRRKDGITPRRAACIVCRRREAKEQRDRIRNNLAVKKCPVCDNAIAAHGRGSRTDLRTNRARLHSGELLEFIREFKLMLEHLPRPLHPLLFSVSNQATVVLNKIMGRRWGEREKEIEDSKQGAAGIKNSAHHRLGREIL